jgi:hypothetical protein
VNGARERKRHEKTAKKTVTIAEKTVTQEEQTAAKLAPPSTERN